MLSLTSANPIVEIDHLSYWYDSSFLSLDDISFVMEQADLLGIIGPNGAGKTTLFNCILGILPDYRGTVKLFGKEIMKNRKVLLSKVGYVPQHTSIEQSFPANIEEIISFGLLGSLEKFSRSYARDQVHKAMQIVGLTDKKNKRFNELSGGQQQRVLIAKAMVHNPKLLILDEPTSGIDEDTQDKFYDLIRKLNAEEKISIILSSHDLDAISKLANKVACINRKMHFHGDAKDFFGDENMLKTYYESAMQAHLRLHQFNAKSNPQNVPST
ncbi:MAG: metal ABC transporter ATP-binding protein [Nitrososphaeraceae archaeon]|jgi:zinc transport system ATP-binding protein